MLPTLPIILPLVVARITSQYYAYQVQTCSLRPQSPFYKQ